MTGFEWFVLLSAVLGALRVLKEANRFSTDDDESFAVAVVGIMAALGLFVLGLHAAGHQLAGRIVALAGLFVGLAPRRWLARLTPGFLPLFDDDDAPALLASAVPDAPPSSLPAAGADRALPPGASEEASGPAPAPPGAGDAPARPPAAAPE